MIKFQILSGFLKSFVFITLRILDGATFRTGHYTRGHLIDELRFWSKYATIIILEAEPISPEIHPLDARRNKYINAHNRLLRKLIPKSGLDGRIFRISANRKVVKHPNGKYMLPDRIHLQKKDEPRVTPPTLLTNINIIANFLCNRFQQNANKRDLCCGSQV